MDHPNKSGDDRGMYYVKQKRKRMALFSNAFTSTIIIAAVTAIPALFRGKSKKIAAKRKENGEKYIEYSSFVFWVIYGGGASFSIIGVLVYLFSDEPRAGIIFIVLGLIFLLPMALLQFFDTSVNWTKDYICGAKSGIRLKKNCVFWKDVESIKYQPNHTIQVKDKSGKSVFWSVYHNGWHEIIDDLRHIRPDIDLSDFE